MADEGVRILEDADLSQLLASPAELVKAYKELREEVYNLEEDLKDETAAHEKLKAAQRKGGRGKGGGASADDPSVQRMMDDLQDQLERATQTLSEKTDAMEDLKAKSRSLEEEVRQARTTERIQSTEIERLKKEMTDSLSASRVEKSKANEYSKQRSDAIEESRRQHEENSRLSERNEALAETVQALSEEKDNLTVTMVNLLKHVEELEAHKDHHELGKEELAIRVGDLEKELERECLRLFLSFFPLSFFCRLFFSPTPSHSPLIIPQLSPTPHRPSPPPTQQHSHPQQTHGGRGRRRVAGPNRRAEKRPTKKPHRRSRRRPRPLRREQRSEGEAHRTIKRHGHWPQTKGARKVAQRPQGQSGSHGSTLRSAQGGRGGPAGEPGEPASARGEH